MKKFLSKWLLFGNGHEDKVADGGEHTLELGSYILHSWSYSHSSHVLITDISTRRLGSNKASGKGHIWHSRTMAEEGCEQQDH